MMQQSRYTVDLNAYMAECEANYLRLLKLLPDNDDEISYLVAFSNQHHCTMKISIKQRCKYTTMLDVVLQASSEWMDESHFNVRIYHDAKMAEVIAFQHQRGIKPVYNYPNENMYQQDEKLQQHRFLSECLSSCLKNGLSEPLQYAV